MNGPAVTGLAGDTTLAGPCASLDETRPRSGTAPALDETVQRAAPPDESHATTPRRPPPVVPLSSTSHPDEVTAVSGSPLALADEATPRRIGRFVVLRRVGRGGMGSVYAAYDEELARRVAVKILHVGLRLPSEGRAPIVAEAQAMARLSHANVVQVYELGEHAGELFFVMEYVEGRTLTAWLKEQVRPWPDVVRMFLAAGQGLAAAHHAGIVHRDFKPDNVLVDRDGAPRVADFGLARPVAEGLAAMAGTPAYMSPEQLLGAATDARSDQFSFCVALHLALYGQAPFAGDDLDALTDSVTRGALRPRPAATSVPARVHEVLVRGLSTDPGRRFPTIEALLGELRRHLPDDAARARRRWLALAMVALLAIVAVLLRGPAQPSPAALLAIDEHVARARAAAERAEWVYPAPTGDGQGTTIRVILALERMPPPAESYARDRADELRQTFAEDLARLGERYWEDPATRPFARDFYAQALVLRPEHELALQRSRLTLGQLSELRERAESAAFSPEQLATVEPLKVLATTQDPEVIARVAAADDRCERAAPARTHPTPAAAEPTPEPEPKPTPGDAGHPSPRKTPSSDSTLLEDLKKAGKKARRVFRD